MPEGLKPAVRITQQIRESKDTTYELDCSGLPLSIRIFRPINVDPSSAWRIEVTAAAVVVSATAGSRALAFALLVERWGNSAAGLFPERAAYRDLDWQAIAAAMAAVRAI